jgi:8-oxo-dGTP diphosphatase
LRCSFSAGARRDLRYDPISCIRCLINTYMLPINSSYMKLKQFTIRVYAIILNKKKDSILVSDEFQKNMRMTKFPGGGLKLSEGTLDCLKREAIEEFGQEIEVLNHFYTTDFFQKALFYEDRQLISIYYLACFKKFPRFKISKTSFDYGTDKEGKQSFRWVKLKAINSDTFTLPIDKKVGELLMICDL